MARPCTGHRASVTSSLGGSPQAGILVLAGVLVVGYVAGVVAAPPHVAVGTGVASLLAVTATGVGAYGMALFNVHMPQHMVLMPILLLAGAPITLALRSLPARSLPRRALLRFLHSRVVAVLSRPLLTTALFVASMYGFTSSDC